VEESYAKAVTALTSNAPELGVVASTIANHDQRHGQGTSHNKKIQAQQKDSVVVAAASTKLARADVNGDQLTAPTLTPSEPFVEAAADHALADAATDEEGQPETVENEDENAEGEDSSSSDDGDEMSVDSDSELDDDDEPFMKVARTPDQVLAEKDEVRAQRRANKRAVKEEKSQKRLNKIKKKDKKKAIKKTKAGNRKNK
jgi:hypothetical protein